MAEVVVMTPFDLPDRDEWDRVMRMTDAELAVYRRRLQSLRELVAAVTVQRAVASAVLRGDPTPLLESVPAGSAHCPHGRPYTYVRADGHRRCACVVTKRSALYAYATTA